MKFIRFLFFLPPLFAQSPPAGSFQKIIEEGKARFFYKEGQYLIIVNTTEQKLFLIKGGAVLSEHQVSTGRGGENARKGRAGTPLGWLKVYYKVGEGEPIGRIFSYKVPTDKISPIYTDKTDIKDDPLITRILALDGLEEGRNKESAVWHTPSLGSNTIDSKFRGINIHGTHEEGLLGTKASHGCIRMRNTEVIELYRLVPEKTLVYITP